jgi:hypothetical protein
MGDILPAGGHLDLHERPAVTLGMSTSRVPEAVQHGELEAGPSEATGTRSVRYDRPD